MLYVFKFKDGRYLDNYFGHPTEDIGAALIVDTITAPNSFIAILIQKGELEPVQIEIVEKWELDGYKTTIEKMGRQIEIMEPAFEDYYKWD